MKARTSSLFSDWPPFPEEIMGLLLTRGKEIWRQLLRIHISLLHFGQKDASARGVIATHVLLHCSSVPSCRNNSRGQMRVNKWTSFSHLLYNPLLQPGGVKCHNPNKKRFCWHGWRANRRVTCHHWDRAVSNSNKKLGFCKMKSNFYDSFF